MGVFGVLVKTLGFVVTAFGKLVGLAKELPDAIRPAWVEGFANAVKEAGDAVDKTGEDMLNWGAKNLSSLGESEKAVGKFFSNLRAEKIPDVELKLKPVQYVAAGAFEKKSREAFTAEVNFRERGKLQNPALDVANKQLAAIQKGNLLLAQVVGKLNFPKLNFGVF